MARRYINLWRRVEERGAETGTMRLDLRGGGRFSVAAVDVADVRFLSEGGEDMVVGARTVTTEFEPFKALLYTASSDDVTFTSHVCTLFAGAWLGRDNSATCTILCNTL